jgi:arsenate reductase
LAGVPDALYFNPSCSKCRTAWSLAEELGLDVQQVRYLDTPPTKAELVALMSMLGIESPREMMRTSEAVYGQLFLADASDEVLLGAIVDHPILLERPIFVRNGKAVIARPPERIRELL